MLKVTAAAHARTAPAAEALEGELAHPHAVLERREVVLARVDVLVHWKDPHLWFWRTGAENAALDDPESLRTVASLVDTDTGSEADRNTPQARGRRS